MHLAAFPSRDILKLLAQEQGRSLDHIAIAHEKEEAYLTTLSQIEPIHAVVEIAQANHGKIPMAVASGGTEKIISLVLERLNIRHLFDAIVTSEMVKNQKPAPDIFLEAARRIGVEPKFCRAYEDTDLGMRAIRAAGMEAVDVRESHRQTLKTIRFAACLRIRPKCHKTLMVVSIHRMGKALNQPRCAFHRQHMASRPPLPRQPLLYRALALSARVVSISLESVLL